MSDITEKLNLLKSVQPTEDWIVKTRSEVLSKAPVSAISTRTLDRSDFGYNFQSLFANKLAISLATFIFVISGGLATVFVSANSLPGESLYSVKLASENVELAVTSEQNKAEVEIKQVGKRVEELAKVSQNHSDVNQKEKIEQLLQEIEVKSSSVNDHLAKMSKDNQTKKAVAVAKIVNNQSEKYAEILSKSNDDLPESIKNDVAEKSEKALASNQATKFSSLMVMVQGKDDVGDEIVTDEEIKEKIQKEIDLEIDKSESAEKVEAVVGSAEKNVDLLKSEETPRAQMNDSTESETVSKTKDDLLNSAQESLTNDDLLEAVVSIVALKDFDENQADIVVQTVTGIESDTEVGTDTVPDTGEVKGDSQTIEANISEENVISEEVLPQKENNDESDVQQTVPSEQEVNLNESSSILPTDDLNSENTNETIETNETQPTAEPTVTKTDTTQPQE